MPELSANEIQQVRHLIANGRPPPAPPPKDRQVYKRLQELEERPPDLTAQFMLGRLTTRMAALEKVVRTLEARVQRLEGR
jgi:hypothetical protein